MTLVQDSAIHRLKGLKAQPDRREIGLNPPALKTPEGKPE
jgi:hypothetical protein